MVTASHCIIPFLLFSPHEKRPFRPNNEEKNVAMHRQRFMTHCTICLASYARFAWICETNETSTHFQQTNLMNERGDNSENTHPHMQQTPSTHCHAIGTHVRCCACWKMFRYNLAVCASENMSSIPIPTIVAGCPIDLSDERKASSQPVSCRSACTICARFASAFRFRWLRRVAGCVLFEHVHT